MKIVLNECYGGFGLSYYAQALYLIASGHTPYFYVDVSSYDDYQKQHRYKRITLEEANTLKHKFFIYCSTTDQGTHIDHFPDNIVNFKNLDRTDPILISVVETMGPEHASGRFARLNIIEVPDGTLYKIDYYDGLESLLTQDDDDWLLAQENECSKDTSAAIKSLWSSIKPATESDPDLTFQY